MAPADNLTPEVLPPPSPAAPATPAAAESSPVTPTVKTLHEGNGNYIVDFICVRVCVNNARANVRVLCVLCLWVITSGWFCTQEQRYLRAL